MQVVTIRRVSGKVQRVANGVEPEVTLKLEDAEQVLDFTFYEPLRSSERVTRDFIYAGLIMRREWHADPAEGEAS